MLKADLSISTILQVNSTIIAGVLILMTVGSFKEPVVLLGPENTLRTLNQWASITIIPFALSSMIAIFAHIFHFDEYSKAPKLMTYFSLVAMLAGFLYLIFLISVLAKT